MPTETQIREALVILHKAMNENPAVLERIASEIDQPGVAMSKASKELAVRIVKQYREGTADAVDHLGLAEGIVKAYTGHR